jgi:hypothetical protein
MITRRLPDFRHLRYLAIAATAFLFAYSPIEAFAGRVNPNSEYVAPHCRQNGSCVRGYHRTVPDGTKCNNYSNRGNVNPWNGKPGTKSPYPETCR